MHEGRIETHQGTLPGNGVSTEGMGKGKRLRRKSQGGEEANLKHAALEKLEKELASVKRKSVANSINISKRLRKTRAEKTHWVSDQLQDRTRAVAEVSWVW